MSVFALSVNYYLNDAETGEAVLQDISVAFERADMELARPGRYVFPLVTDLLERYVRKQFDSEGSGTAGEWAALSPKYEAEKEKRHPGAPIMVASGNLRAALTGASSYAYRAFDDEGLEYGTSGLPYASFFQLGTTRMPARPLFDFDGNFERELRGAAIKGVRKALEVARVTDFAEVSDQEWA